MHWSVRSLPVLDFEKQRAEKTPQFVLYILTKKQRLQRMRTNLATGVGQAMVAGPTWEIKRVL